MKAEVTDQELQLLALLRQQKWGRVTLRYQNGKLSEPIETHETLKLEDLSLDKRDIIKS